MRFRNLGIEGFRDSKIRSTGYLQFLNSQFLNLGLAKSNLLKLIYKIINKFEF
jgi:hypothetical protein